MKSVGKIVVVACLIVTIFASSGMAAGLDILGLQLGKKIDSLSEINDLVVPVLLSNRKIAVSQWFLLNELWFESGESGLDGISWGYNNSGEMVGWNANYSEDSLTLKERVERKNWGLADYTKLAESAQVSGFRVSIQVGDSYSGRVGNTNFVSFIVDRGQYRLQRYRLEWDTIFDALNIPFEERPHRKNIDGFAIFLMDKFNADGDYNNFGYSALITNYQEGYEIEIFDTGNFSAKLK